MASPTKSRLRKFSHQSRIGFRILDLYYVYDLDWEYSHIYMYEKLETPMQETIYIVTTITCGYVKKTTVITEEEFVNNRQNENQNLNTGNTFAKYVYDK